MIWSIRLLKSEWLAHDFNSPSSLPSSTTDVASASMGGDFATEDRIHISSTMALDHHQDGFMPSFDKAEEGWNGLSGDQEPALYPIYDSPLSLRDV